MRCHDADAGLLVTHRKKSERLPGVLTCCDLDGECRIVDSAPETQSCAQERIKIRVAERGAPPRLYDCAFCGDGQAGDEASPGMPSLCINSA